MFIELFALFLFVEGCGAVIALACVGQRDTRWLTPLTVSSGYQGEEGNRSYQALQTIPRL
jgi:hypothetical protein